ncbi:MAG: type II toxin-antitoxin system Phd/YefM family antitoxin [Deltaproteobacteria bacterium]|nr:type II toxin-antitoxin system Phd/YefM family antitoxin [Deltaproteobacteria bacterium]
MSKFSAVKAREAFSEVVSRAAYGKERILVTRKGKNVAAIVPMEDVQLLEKLEDCIDIDDARRALEEKGTIPFEKIKKALGFK